MPIVIGYHGCSKEAAQQLLGGASFEASNKPYDWLGKGSYFWENDILRAYEWAQERRPVSPCVVGAVIELGHCLDLTTRGGVEAVSLAYKSYLQIQQRRNKPLPRNEPGRNSKAGELPLRHLDRAVIDHLHLIYQRASRADNGKTKEFETVRAMFLEGQPIYETAGFLEKTHVQIAVKEEAQILGVFRIPGFQLRALNLPELYDFKN